MFADRLSIKSSHGNALLVLQDVLSEAMLGETPSIKRDVSWGTEMACLSDIKASKAGDDKVRQDLEAQLRAGKLSLRPLL